MKVLIFELDSTFGGIESFILNMLENIDFYLENIHIDIVTSFENLTYEKKFEREGVSIIRIPSKKNIRLYRSEIEKLIIAKKYDIMHVQKNSLVNSIPIDIAMKYNVPVIVHAQNSASSHHGLITNVVHKIHRKRLKNRNLIKFACGTNAAIWMFETTKSVLFVKNGISVNEFIRREDDREIFRKQFGLNDELTICHVGRFTKQKNHSFIIEIFRQLKMLHSNSKLLLVGDGEKFRETQELVKSYHIENDVIFFGSLTREDERKILIASDIFLMPSLYEGVSIASMEAQMAGLSLLISNTVDKDTNVTGNVRFLSLDETAEYWAKCIADELMPSLPKYDENKLIKDFRRCGYDMASTTKDILNVYRENIK